TRTRWRTGPRSRTRWRTRPTTRPRTQAPPRLSTRTVARSPAGVPPAATTTAEQLLPHGNRSYGSPGPRTTGCFASGPESFDSDADGLADDVRQLHLRVVPGYAVWLVLARPPGWPWRQW